MINLHTVAVETMLARDVLPESSTNLVTLKILCEPSYDMQELVDRSQRQPG